MDRPPQHNAAAWPLLADLLADLVLLLVERTLFGLGDVAAIGARHGALFLADRVILGVQLVRLRLGDLTFAALGVDALALMRQTAVHLLAARMVLLPLRFTSQRIASNADECHGGERSGHGGTNGFQHVVCS